ncbi:MAG: response regulator [Deltaproteobacteria bacterium]|nr:response regulator [Deltaproteobacteria bacterium]
MSAPTEELLQSKILVIDDEVASVELISRVLRRAGHTEVKGSTHPEQATLLFREFRPDLVLLDLSMPKMDGFAVMAELIPYMEEVGFPPILVLTGNTEEETKKRCLASGASDYLQKPFDATEIKLRVRNLLEAHLLYRTVRSQKDDLERRVLDRTMELRQAQLEILERLAQAAEFRDDDTGEHTHRVGAMARGIGAELGMSMAEVELLERASTLHDVGKIAIPDAILLKPGKLTAEEFDEIKTHTTKGAKLLAGSQFQLLQRAEEIAHFHHENWDGTGYPTGLKGDAIPIAARITAVADVFDALTHDRPYKKAWSRQDAVAEIHKLSGRKFDPAVVSAFSRWLANTSGGAP